MLPVLINGYNYDWGSIIVTLNGVPVAGLKEVNYNEQQEIINHYGAGRYPVSRSKGRVTATASITLTADEVEALQKASLTGRLQDIPPFDITITYIKTTQNIVTHVLRDCQIVSNTRKVKENDSEIQVVLNLVLSKIEWKRVF